MSINLHLEAKNNKKTIRYNYLVQTPSSVTYKIMSNLKFSDKINAYREFAKDYVDNLEQHIESVEDFVSLMTKSGYKVNFEAW